MTGPCPLRVGYRPVRGAASARSRWPASVWRPDDAVTPVPPVGARARAPGQLGERNQGLFP